jgi:MFS family permease
LYLSPLFWGALRFLCGMTSFGLFMVIESWLNECTESNYRGRVFSIYMILSYLGIGVGQQLLNLGDDHHSIFRPDGPAGFFFRPFRFLEPGACRLRRTGHVSEITGKSKSRSGGVHSNI